MVGRAGVRLNVSRLTELPEMHHKEPSGGRRLVGVMVCGCGDDDYGGAPTMKVWTVRTAETLKKNK